MTPAFDPYVVPVTVVILVLLFAVQSRGTARVAAFFGPIMTVWFLVIAAFPALSHCSTIPSVLTALNPLYGIRVSDRPRRHRLGHPWRGVPGGDRRRSALRRPRTFRPQADPDRLARRSCCRPWRLNYLAQGALVLADPAAIENPFFLLVPDWALLPIVAAGDDRDGDREPSGHHRRLLADAQAIQLGLMPRLAIRHTSETHLGQIYHPARQCRVADRRSAAGRVVFQTVERARRRPMASPSPPPWWSRRCSGSSSSGNCGAGRR